MATILVDTSLCNADYIVYLSNTESVGRYVTVRDVGSNPSFFATHSIIISTTSGYSFFEGEKEYIRRPGDSLTFAAMSSRWRLMNTLAYTPAGRTVMCNVSTTHMYTSTFSNSVGPLYIMNFLSTGKLDIQNSMLVQSDPVINQPDLTSTFVGLGTLGIISSHPDVQSNLLSSSLGLATTYMSTQHLNSTIVGLASLSYVSTTWLTSTFQGLGPLYISIPQLTSTVAGLGPTYISTASAISTVQGLGQTYVSIPQLVSTVSTLFGITTSNHQSTFSKLGLIYISSASLVSTVTGLSNIGSSNNYILASNFNSTFTGVGITDLSNSTSTIAGLATVGYISYTQLQSTVSNVFVINQSNVSQTLSSLGSIYLSAPSLQSTVAGLGTIDTKGYISTVQLVSTVDGLQAPTKASLISTVAGLGQLYVSTSGLVSTTVGLCNDAYTMITSSINGMGSIYISSGSLQSTTAGLGPPYILMSQLISTTDGVNYPMLSTTNALGSLYLSSPSLVSSVAGLGSPPYRYISTMQLTSTTTGIKTSGYISVPALISTTISLSNYSVTPLVSTVQGLGQTYLSTTISPDAFIVSTLPIPSYSYTGVPITVMSNILYFASTTTIYSYNLSTSTLATVASNLSEIKGITASPTLLFLTSGNIIIILSRSDGSLVKTFGNSAAAYVDGTDPNLIRFNNPYGIVFDPLYAVFYVADYGNSAIRRVQLGTLLSPLSVMTIATVPSPIGITIDSDKYLYVTNYTSIYKVSIFNKISSTESSVSVVAGSPNCYGICSEPSNTYLYTTNYDVHSIYRQQLSPLGSTQIGSGSPGSNDGIASNASFYNPTGICFNPVDMCLYSIDQSTSLIRRTTTQLYQSTINGLTLSTRSATQTQTTSLTSPTVNNFITGLQPTVPSLPIAGPVFWLDGADPLNTGTAPANGTLTNWVNKAGGMTTREGTGTLTYTSGAVTFNNAYLTTNINASVTNRSIFVVFNPSSVNTGSGAEGAALVSTQTGAGVDVIINNGDLRIQNSSINMVRTYFNDTEYASSVHRIVVGASGTIYFSMIGTETSVYSLSGLTGILILRFTIFTSTNRQGLFVDSQERYLYITATQNIYKFDMNVGGALGTTRIGLGCASARDLCVIGTTVYIADFGANGLKKITTTDIDQTATRWIDIDNFSGAPVGITTDGTYLYVSWYKSTNNNSIITGYVSKHNTDGLVLFTVNMGTVTGNTYTGMPGGLCVTADQYLYFTMPHLSSIYAIFIPTFQTAILAYGNKGFPGYSDGNQATTLGVTFRSPEGIAVDSLRNFFIADTGNNIIRKAGPDIAHTPISINTPYIFSGIIRVGVYTGTTIRLNGINKDAGSYPVSFPSSTYIIGGYYGYGTNSPLSYNGTISEVIIYNSALSDTDRAAVETYLTTKWTTTTFTERTTVDLSLTTQLTSTKPITANIMTARTFQAFDGRLGGPNHGFYTGDATYVNSISDMRLKENIQTITFPLEKVKALQAVQYRMSSDPSRRWIGYIAQDVEPILPEIVRTDTNGWKSIQYTQLPGLAIEAVKELAAKYAHIQSLLSTLG